VLIGLSNNGVWEWQIFDVQKKKTLQRQEWCFGKGHSMDLQDQIVLWHIGKLAIDHLESPILHFTIYL